jgi:hypothetical protein
VIDGLNQGQKGLPRNRDLHLIQEALATRPLFAVDLLIVREAQLEGGGHPFQSQSWIWIDFSGFFRGSLNLDMGRDGLRIKIQDPTAEAKFNQFEERLRALEVSTRVRKPSTQNGQEVAPVKIAADVASLNNRMNSLSTAILASPERALAIPLLRRDIDGISKRMEELRVQGKSEMDRLYDQQKWILGGIGTVLLAVAGGAITIILRTLPKGDKESV